MGEKRLRIALSMAVKHSGNQSEIPRSPIVFERRQGKIQQIGGAECSKPGSEFGKNSDDPEDMAKRQKAQNSWAGIPTIGRGSPRFKGVDGLPQPRSRLIQDSGMIQKVFLAKYLIIILLL